MRETHKVRFEPVGVDIEADEDETILDAAFRQGVMLMHGCKEGQCSACKSFVLEGDVQMDRYSTFALADYESDEGYVLLCRGHAYSDLEIELVNYDEDMIRLGLPVVTAQTEVESITGLTHDISLVRLRMTDDAGLRFHPGQYVDITIPGTEEHRSFSMANISVAEGILEFVIKRYPGGKFSRLLDGVLAPGDPLMVSGPYGTFTLRVSSDRAPGLRWRRRRDVADSFTAGPDGRKRQRTGGDLLLWSPDGKGPLPYRRNGGTRRAIAQVPVRAVPFGIVAGRLAVGRFGGRDRLGHRRARAARVEPCRLRRLPVRSAAHDRCSLAAAGNHGRPE
jgi:ferredoxin